MRIVTTTPFGARPVTACLMETQRIGRSEAPVPEVDKWQVFDALTRIGADFGLGDRTLGVLRVLLSFHPEKTLKDGRPMVVFASNAAICERAHGMPESTLRRHLVSLVEAGLILRHDSPNGKRYARRGPGGQIVRAFGFDLRPLLVRSVEIGQRAAEQAVQEQRIQSLREEISLMLRDAVKLVLFAQEQGLTGYWDALDDRARLARRFLRRKLTEAQLTTVKTEMQSLLDDIYARLDVDMPEVNSPETEPKTDELSGNPVRIERHYQRSDKEPADKERSPIALVLEACPDVHPYLEGRIDWKSFLDAMCKVAPMTGIDTKTWAEACRVMGPEDAAATVAAIVQRIGQITNPGAYLRVLTQKAGEGDFSPLPLLTSMIRKAA